jgi:hypothetical protein
VYWQPFKTDGDSMTFVVIGKTRDERVPERREVFSSAKEAFAELNRMGRDGYQDIKVIGPDGEAWLFSRLVNAMKTDES